MPDTGIKHETVLTQAERDAIRREVYAEYDRTHRPGIKTWVAYWSFVGASAVVVVLVTDHLAAKSIGVVAFGICVAAIVRGLSLHR